MKVYYAHHIWKYNTQEESEEILKIKKYFNCEIINPNGEVKKTGEESYIMEQCFSLVKHCDVVVFTTLLNGHFGKGVYSEVEFALKNNKKVYLLFDDNFTCIDSLQDISEIIVDRTKTNRLYATLKDNIMFKVLTCSCCKSKKKIKKNIFTVGDMAKASGFNSIVNIECKVYWLCPNCYNKALILSKKLADIIGEKDITLNCIIKNNTK